MRLAAAIALGCCASPAAAAMLGVGPGERFAAPSAAIAAAQPGDTVRIAPGTYYDCAAWSTDRLTIEGAGAVLSDRSCQGKAAFVIGGAGTVLRGLTFTRLRVPDRNAAGIRLEAGSLSVVDCVFEDDEAGIIAGDISGGAILVQRSLFRQVGVPGGPLAAITVGAMASLRIEDSRFDDPRGEGGAVRTAAPTAIVGGVFAAGPAQGAIVDASGPLEVNGSAFQLQGPRLGAIRAAGPVASLHRVTLENTAGSPQTLLVDWTDAGASLDGDVVGPGDREWTRRGLYVARVKAAAHVTVDALRHTAGRLRRALP